MKQNHIFSLILATCLVAPLLPGGRVGAQVVISEFMAINNSTVTNTLGQTSDWIELHNGSTNAVDLAGWYLTDDPGDLIQCALLSTNIGAGGFVLIHCCGDVDELFDDLVDIGVNCFNPFQPEAMDVYSLLPEYRNRLSFFGGMSLQDVLPHGTADEVRQDTRSLLMLGSEGGYVFSPSHDVPGDVPVQNMLAFISEVHDQEGYEA